MSFFGAAAVVAAIPVSGGPGSFIQREYDHEYVLNDNVDLNRLRFELTFNGIINVPNEGGDLVIVLQMFS